MLDLACAQCKARVTTQTCFLRLNMLARFTDHILAVSAYCLAGIEKVQWSE